MHINEKNRHITRLSWFDTTLPKYIFENESDDIRKIRKTYGLDFLNIETLAIAISQHRFIKNKNDMKFWNEIFVLLLNLDKNGIQPPDKIFNEIDILLSEIGV